MISCIVLAGGQSKRMGKDKAFLEIKGKSFLKNVLESVSQYCFQIVIVGNKEKDLYLREARGISSEVEFKKDIYPYEGPLNGIISALDSIKGDIVFIATCDTPLLISNIIPYLESKLDGFDAVIPVIKGKFQPLNTIYKREALERAVDLFKKGERSLFSFIKSINTLYLSHNEVKKVDPELQSYWSINTPVEYEKLVNYLNNS